MSPSVGQTSGSFEQRARRYWLVFGIGLFLSVVLDLLTTLVAIHKYSITAEINPLMRWLLRQGPLILVAAHFMIVLIVVYLFSRILETIRLASTPFDRYLETLVQLWLGLILVGGVIIVINNVSAIVLEQSLL